MTTLADLCLPGGVQTGPFGSQLHAEEYSSQGVPVVMPQDIGDNRIEVDAIARVPEDVAARLARHMLKPGDIVYSRRGDVERRAWVSDNQNGWLCGTGCLRVRVNPSLADSRFVSYYLGTSESRSWIVSHAVGATMLNLNTKILAAVPMAVPSIDSQRSIAEVLGALDDKIAANDRVSAMAVHLADSEFQSAKNRNALAITAFGAVCTAAGGGTPSTKVPEFWEGDIPWATPTDVTALSSPYLDRTTRWITETGLAHCSSALFPVGSILMTSRATIGAFALAKTPIAVNQGFIVAEAHDPSAQLWLFHEMRSRVDDFLAHANGATFLELNKARFRAIEVRWPTNSGAFAQFSGRVTPLHDRAYAAALESRALVNLRDTLLPHLMSGRITVREAEKAVEEVL